MKKAVGAVRVSLARRRPVSPETNQYELPPNVPEEPYHQAAHENFSPPSPPPRLSEARRMTTTDLQEIASTSKWSTQKKILLGISAALLLSILIVVPVVLIILLVRSADTTTTTSTTTETTAISLMWSFDNTTLDSSGIYNGLLVNGAQYSVIATNQPYIGYGQALYLISSSNQSFTVSTPFLDFTYKSFTIEAWIYLMGSTAVDRGIFTQCQCSTCANQCLYLIVRAGYLYGGFIMNDLIGVSSLQTTTWYHVAFVYNYQTQQQILYLNGVQEAIKSNVQPYQGTNGSIQIGSTQVYSVLNYFFGYIDNLKVTTRAKTATELLSAASLTAYYSFDLPNSNGDSGPNGLNGTLVTAIIVTGRVNQAIRCIGNLSYFRAYGFFQAGYGVNANKPFSFSMWINPSSLIACTFLQQTTGLGSGPCSYMLGIWANGVSSGQLVAQGSGGSTMFGPFLTINSWIHISFTYSFTNGYSLYSKGTLVGTTGSASSTASNVLAWLYIGYGGTCGAPNSFSNTGFQGSIDEVYIHNRELTSTDVAALANP